MERKTIMNDNALLWQLLLQVILIALNAVFACAEIAVISFNDNKLARLAEQGRQARGASRPSDEPAGPLSRDDTGSHHAGRLFRQRVAADNFSDMLTEWLVGLGVSLPGFDA